MGVAFRNFPAVRGYVRDLGTGDASAIWFYKMSHLSDHKFDVKGSMKSQLPPSYEVNLLPTILMLLQFITLLLPSIISFEKFHLIRYHYNGAYFPLTRFHVWT